MPQRDKGEVRSYTWEPRQGAKLAGMTEYPSFRPEAWASPELYSVVGDHPEGRFYRAGDLATLRINLDGKTWKVRMICTETNEQEARFVSDGSEPEEVENES